MQIQFDNDRELRSYLSSYGSDLADDSRYGDGRWNRLAGEAKKLSDDLSLEQDWEDIPLESWERWYDH
ncbi:hypothetical protein [Aestuariispira insulae]|uniref:Uncharacterized protein n=1 Tax=Aestuariispira insulae TaxID=1461337 RepID=A0A3D9HRM6_9PROT|nr:hypothetical protein [Aestuariispira insulae]RED51526.1 hypothetical protein DFP90_103328 [Aestuariispira insulae]